MRNIKVLDDLTIQKIAAGEVIENPASVVKELVENSIDAGGKNIIIEISKGGKKLIRVTDDGVGMDRSNLKVAFKRHSTSKLSIAEDVYNIVSLGFRGEALASISSVAKVEVISKTKNDLKGSKALVEDGNIKELEDIGSPVGTTMIIKDIFYNLPVRKKFLKTDRQESYYISNIIKRLMLGNPEVSMKFIKDGVNEIQTSGRGNLINTIYEVLGKDIANNLIKLDYSDNYISINGYISNNTLYRGNRNFQYTYINGRYIKDFGLVKVIEDRYKSLIPISRFPTYVINIELNPAEIDVNIHPTKQEVKFVDKNRVFGTISNVIDRTLKENKKIPILGKQDEKKTDEGKEELIFYDEKNLNDKISANELNQNNLYKDNSSFKNTNFSKKNYSSDYHPSSNTIDIDEIDITDFFNSLGFNEEIEVNETSNKESSKNIEEKPLGKIDASLINATIIGRIFQTYIILEDSRRESIYFIDQHAAHERVMYEKYKKEFLKEEVVIQRLMVPEVISLNTEEKQILEENINIFTKLGFDIDMFGDNTISLRGVPLIFGNPETKSLFLDILDNLELNIESSYDVKVEKIMKISCVNAIKSGDYLSDEEIKALLSQLLKCDNPYSCPHGRPTIMEMTKAQIEKDFKRIN